MRLAGTALSSVHMDLYTGKFTVYSLLLQDFHDIFMAGGVKNMTDPDHKEFLM